MSHPRIIALVLALAPGGRAAAGPTATGLVEAGLAAGRAHRWNEALTAFARAVGQDPTLPSAWANHGTALLNLGRPAEAIASYERARALDPRDAYVHCSLASACHALGRPGEALRHADAALAVDAEFAPAMANKAKAVMAAGRTEEARRLFERAFTLQPDLRNHFPEAGDPGPDAAPAPPVHHLLIEVRDLDRSLAFYRDRLGFTLTRRTGGFAMVETGSIGVYLWEGRWSWSPKPPKAGREPGGLYPHLTLPDVRRTVAELRAAGDRIVAEPREFNYGMEAFVADPDGFVWALLSPPPPATPR